MFDDQGSGLNDLFVIIDGAISHTYVVDSSGLGDFFDTANEPLLTEEALIKSKKADVAYLILLWEEMLLNAQPICYLPFDLSDQYVGALKIVKGRKLHTITQVCSPVITSGVQKDYFLQVQKEIDWQKSADFKWSISPSAMLTGLRWSLAKLEQPVIPLRYE
ncbi:hypothetical protein ACFSUS_09620 [Spirosoma soli]|uniref:Uncharacterized protein n=1 Tax=Spirosoma soli TaxID=1770529 RepID=A0ABW5M1I0_9BACT